MKKQNSNQNAKVEKVLVFVKTFDYYHHKFNFGNFFNCPVKLLKNLDRNLILAMYKMLFEELYFTLLAIAFFFEATPGLGRPKKPPSLKYISHISYNADSWQSYPKKILTQRRPQIYIYIYIHMYIYGIHH